MMVQAGHFFESSRRPWVGGKLNWRERGLEVTGIDRKGVIQLGVFLKCSNQFEHSETNVPNIVCGKKFIYSWVS